MTKSSKDAILHPLYIDDMETNYMITRSGKIYSKITNKFLKPSKTPKGYMKIELSTIYGPKTYLVHRLVAMTFVYGMTSERNQVNHKNGKKNNNPYENLEWTTAKENIDHSRSTGLNDYCGEKVSNSRCNNDTIRNICKLLENGHDYEFILKNINWEINYTNLQYLSKIKNRKSWKHISSQYNIPTEKMIKRVFTDEIVHEICILLEKGWKIPKIADVIEGKYKIKRDVIRSTCRNIKIRKKHKNISKNYIW